MEAISIAPSSPDYFAFGPYLLKAGELLATPNITSIYAGSKVASFDMKSMSSGCGLSTQNGVVAPAFSCVIRYTGVKAGTGKIVTFEAKPFIIAGPRILGLPVSSNSEKVQRVEFPAEFNGLTSLSFEIVKPKFLPVKKVISAVAIDDVTYTVHFRG